MVSDNVKKNLFDLEYNKNLQYFNTIIILVFAYIIGIIIAFLTHQIDYENGYQLLFTFFISIIFLIISSVLMIVFRTRLRIIISEIKELKI